MSSTVITTADRHTVGLTEFDGVVTLTVANPEGKGVTARLAGYDAAYVAGWLSVVAGIDLKGLTDGARAVAAARGEAIRDTDDVRDRTGAH